MMICGFVCVHVSDSRHTCGDVFVSVSLTCMFAGEDASICLQSPIHMYTVPSSGHHEEGSQDALKESRIWIPSNFRLVPWRHTGQSFQDGLGEGRKGQASTWQGTLCRVQPIGSSFLAWGERTHPLVWRQGH